MLGLELILIVVLQFEGTEGGDLHLYHRSGDDAVLRCSSSTKCYNINWFYSRKSSHNHQQQVKDGKVVQSSSRAARLNADSNCSLIINNITAEDAGIYTCRYGSGSTYDGRVILNVLTISPSSPADDPTKDGDVTLLCSLVRYFSLGSCPENSLLWVDDTGTNLTGEGVGYQFRQTGCDSYLTVKLQTISRRYSCQFVNGNTVKIEAHYQLEEAVPPKNTNIINILLGAVIGVLVPLVVLAVVFIKCRKTRVKEDHRTTTESQYSTHESRRHDKEQSNPTYATVKSFNPRTPQRKKVTQDEDTVTYSVVNIKGKREENIDPNSLYSNATKLK